MGGDFFNLFTILVFSWASFFSMSLFFLGNNNKPFLFQLFY
jgi:hypothetical protein